MFVFSIPYFSFYCFTLPGIVSTQCNFVLNNTPTPGRAGEIEMKPGIYEGFQEEVCYSGSGTESGFSLRRLYLEKLVDTGSGRLLVTVGDNWAGLQFECLAKKKKKNTARLSISASQLRETFLRFLEQRSTCGTRLKEK